MENKEIKKKLRILHMPGGVALYQPYLLTRGLRLMGHKADYLAYYVPETAAWLMQGTPDFNLNLRAKNYNFFDILLNAIKIIGFFIWSLFNYDVFHFHSGLTFTPQRGFLKKYFLYFDVKILKLLRKKVVFQWWGCQIRLKQIDEKYKYSCCHTCTLQRQSFGEGKENCNDEFKIKVVALTKKLGDLNLTSGDLLVMFPHMKLLNNAVNTDLWKPLPFEEIPEKFRLPKTDNLKIYHAYGNAEIRAGDAKGSSFVKKAVEELQKEGYKIELMIFDKVPNLDLRYYQMQADICVDQLRAGCYGSNAVECMAVGKPVIVYMRNDVLKILPPDLPIVNANPDNIKEVLRGLIEHKELREKIGKQSREFAVKKHDFRAVAKKLEEYYYSI
ncbi:MAG: glycosyltransferase [Candidatus Pacebacteria bacterium]|nr:glycosyltransferase [Candidatus Paceibacterota bacterium]